MGTGPNGWYAPTPGFCDVCGHEGARLFAVGWRDRRCITAVAPPAGPALCAACRTPISAGAMAGGFDRHPGCENVVPIGRRASA